MSFEPRSRRIEDLERKLEALAYVASSRDLATSPAGDPAVLGVVRSALQQLHAVREDMERVAAERDVARTALGQARECEARWRSIVENPFDYVLIVDRDATLQYVNRTLPGTRKEDLIGKATVFDFVAPEFHETVRGALDRVFETGEFVHFEVYAKPPVDDWFRTLVGAVKENGNVVAASMFSCNIVRRKQVEKALGESEERFRQLTEHIEDVFYLIEPETRRVLYVSPAYERLWGRPLQTVYDDALAWTKAIHPEDRDRVLAGFESLTDSNYSFGSAREYRIVRPDGSLRWVRGRNFAIRDEDGNLSRVAGIVTDITERKEARAKIAEAESKYRLLVEKLPVISYIAALDDARTTIYISPQIEWKLGFTQAEWTADPGLWMKRIHPDDRARTLAAMRRFRETGEPLRTVYRLMSRGGEALWFRDEAVLVSDDSGKPTRVQGVMLDISEAEEARAERQRARALSAQLVEVQEAERRSSARELPDESGETRTGRKRR
ncbi:MAG: PAS domain-containing protein, partial [Candidatus Krumholzibacteriia bacterium]